MANLGVLDLELLGEGPDVSSQAVDLGRLGGDEGVESVVFLGQDIHLIVEILISEMESSALVR